MPGEGDLGHYRLVKLLGRGGMGQVWLAEDTRLEREVALKLLPVELAADEDYRRRFEREARLAARLRGPHVVPIHAFGESASPHSGVSAARMPGVGPEPLSAAPSPSVTPPGSVPQGGMPAGATHSPGMMAHEDAASAVMPPPGVLPRPGVPRGGVSVSGPFGVTSMTAASPAGGMAMDRVDYVSPHSYSQAGTGYSTGTVPPMEKPRVRPWQPVWWVVLGLLVLLFGLLAIATVLMSLDRAFDGMGETVVAWFMFVAPFALFVWLVVREVKKFRAERRRWREAGAR
ncbi:hypothetical protein GPX89_17745 [Nocardia sp. ET3-3]|uniref:non-specific serine/threonine protein kinase n=1 Tax=Nocardia terrae TaxID=2675851 RepID=A0A7K1UXQ5_9NOCA|nr:hypothetical protein [Nocardia terrae]